MMEHRPHPKYSQKICREHPSINIRKKLIENFQKGGVKFEDNIKVTIGELPLRMKALIGKKSKILSEWIYVGDGWWCIKNMSKFEFGKLMAIKVENDEVIIEGTWDESKHGFEEQPEIVFDKDGRSGHIIAFNKWEIYISWFKDGKLGVPVMYNKLDEITFKYIEDHRKYLKLYK